MTTPPLVQAGSPGGPPKKQTSDSAPVAARTTPVQKQTPAQRDFQRRREETKTVGNFKLVSASGSAGNVSTPGILADANVEQSLLADVRETGRVTRRQWEGQRNVAADTIISFIPGVWASDWKQMSWKERAANIALDVLTLPLPVGRTAATAARATRSLKVLGVGRDAKVLTNAARTVQQGIRSRSVSKIKAGGAVIARFGRRKGLKTVVQRGQAIVDNASAMAKSTPKFPTSIPSAGRSAKNLDTLGKAASKIRKPNPSLILDNLTPRLRNQLKKASRKVRNLPQTKTVTKPKTLTKVALKERDKGLDQILDAVNKVFLLKAAQRQKAVRQVLKAAEDARVQEGIEQAVRKTSRRSKAGKSKPVRRPKAKARAKQARRQDARERTDADITRAKTKSKKSKQRKPSVTVAPRLSGQTDGQPEPVPEPQRIIDGRPRTDDVKETRVDDEQARKQGRPERTDRVIGDQARPPIRDDRRFPRRPPTGRVRTPATPKPRIDLQFPSFGNGKRTKSVRVFEFPLGEVGGRQVLVRVDRAKGTATTRPGVKGGETNPAKGLKILETTDGTLPTKTINFGITDFVVSDGGVGFKQSNKAPRDRRMSGTRRFRPKVG